jgi:hypothetical protein
MAQGAHLAWGCLIRLYVPHAVQSPGDENIIYGLTSPGLIRVCMYSMAIVTMYT